MIIERTHNVDWIKSVLSIPVIADAITEDGCNLDSVPIEPKSVCYLRVSDNNKDVALYVLVPLSACSIEIHAHVLPAFRKTQQGFDSGRFALSWVFSKTHYKKVNAQVPTIYENNVGAYCELHGLKREGINRCSYVKNDVVHDQIYYGITKNEFDKFDG